MSAAPPLLNARLVAADPRLAAHAASARLPERVLQFGEGNFLRAFVDWMLQRMNERGLFGGRAVVVQPLPRGQADALAAQDGLFTVVLRGLVDGRRVETRELVSSVSRCLDPYRDFDAFLACARNPELRFVVSNTTEAGIQTDPADRLDARPAASFPGKLTQLLEARCRHFGGDPRRGLVMLPCELIDRNGDALARAVLETARAWDLSPAFIRWVGDACVFANTLVDRIVTGHPREEAVELAARLGYRDELLVAGEIFHSWVIEAPSSLADELPLAAAGIDVIETRDLSPYRERKVRILNGAHTLMALVGFLAGQDTVGDCMADDLVRAYVERALAREILPTIAFPAPKLEAFAASVTERFRNPFIRHPLSAIALNSVSKLRTRLLPALLEGARATGRPPSHLTFALAALAAVYRAKEIEDGALIGRRGGVPYRVVDEPHVLAFFVTAWRSCPPGAETPEACLTLARRLLARDDFWGAELTSAVPGLDAAVGVFLHAIVNEGAAAALGRLVEREQRFAAGGAT